MLKRIAFIVLGGYLTALRGVFAAELPPITAADPESIQRVVEAAARAGETRVVITPGTYHLPGSSRSEGKRGWHLYWEGLKNLTIEATGVTLVFKDRTQPSLRFYRCENVTLRGATLVRGWTAFSQGQIVALDREANTVDIRIDQGYPDDLDNVEIFPHLWTNVFEEKSRRWLTQLRAPNANPARRIGPLLWRVNMERLDSVGVPICVGMRLAWRGQVYDDVSLSECSKMRMEGITIRGGSGMCFHETGGEGGNIYLDCRVTYGPLPETATEPPLLASNADGFHSSDVRRGPTLVRCSFEGLDDDAIAIHGFFGLIAEGSGNRVIVRKQNAAKDPLFSKEGDSLNFYNQQGLFVAEAKVVSSRVMEGYKPQVDPPALYRVFQETPRDKNYLEITLDRKIDVQPGWQVANVNECGSDYIIRDCVIRNSFARGILPKASRGLIEGCLIENTARAAIELIPELSWWSESDYSQNVIIRRNVIRHASTNRKEGPLRHPGAVTIFAFVDGNYVGVPGGHRNILIEENRFESNDGVNLLVTSADGVTIRKNRFESPMMEPSTFGKSKNIDSQCLVWFTQCRRVRLEGNAIAKPGPGLKVFVGQGPQSDVAGVKDGFVAEATLPSDSKQFELYLLVGQSNMAGRGTLAENDKHEDPRIFVLNAKEEWINQGEPIHFDKPEAGVGPGFSFAKALAQAKPGITIGLIPCAVGGTPISRWKPGADLYENALRRARIAMQRGQLKGILWHQGEANCGSASSAAAYGRELKEIVEGFRRDLSLPQLPFVAGELGEFLVNRPDGTLKYSRELNAQIDALSKSLENFQAVSAAGLRDKGDLTHFDADSQRELGKRYAQALLKIPSESR